MIEKNEVRKNESPKKENSEEENKKSKNAFEQAEEDIENDPETELNKDEDLDEGELARKEGHP